jgi:hypothetical protein
LRVSTDPGIENLTCRHGVPAKPDVKLASSILSACSWYNFCNSAFSTCGTVLNSCAYLQILGAILPFSALPFEAE